MLKRFFYSLVAILFFSQVTSLQAVPTSSQSKESAKSFIEDLGRRAVESLTRSGVSQSELESNFQALLEEGFDVPAIGQFVMGRYWNRMSPDQQARFIPLFENRLKKSYANRFQEYRGVNFVVKDARKQSSYFIVSSTIQRPGGPLTPVDWSVRDAKIHDVKVEGVSMSITLRDDYYAFVDSNNGDMEKFLEALGDASK